MRPNGAVLCCEDRNTALPKSKDPSSADPKPTEKDERPRARLEWDALPVFLAVAETGSINRAAAELKIQPSSVSRRIDELEKRLEAKLFVRASTGMTLTSAGEDLRDSVRTMRHHADNIERKIRRRDKRDEGMVALATPDGIGSLWLAPRVGSFLAANPRIQLSMDCRFGPALPERKPDISIVADKSIIEVGDDTSELCTMHYVFFAAPNYLATYGTPRSVASAVSEHRTLRHTAQITQRENWGARASAVEALASFGFETNSSQAVISALREGAGIATAPSYLKVLAPELVMIGTEPAVPIKLWLILHREAREAQRVARVAEWIRAAFDPRTNPWFRDEFVHPDDFAETQKPAATRTTSKRTRR